MDTTKFNTQEELFKHLKQNKAFYISQKKSAIKRGDSFTYALPLLSKNEVENKDMGVSSDEPTGKIRVKAIINASNMLDSHMDVHIGNIWKKSLQENKYILHLESHEREFDAVISDSPDVTASVKSLTWKSIGYDYEGSTYALIFDSYISSSRNEKMFNQYRNGWVKQHSVGMQYVSLYLCMNSTEKYYAEEKANWDKYINEVANKQTAMDIGYFWAVTEAKLIEGSAVVLASNSATPTQSVETVEAGKSTSNTIEPVNEATQNVFLNPNLF
jgi:hypothetical protein